MDQHLKFDDMVKEISIGNGCLHVDLSNGLRLSGPLGSNDDVNRASQRPRRMMVSGHEAINSQALAFG
ncbi:MAG: hypothetical protein AB1437_24260 [Pseudomonadota bacterium]